MELRLGDVCRLPVETRRRTDGLWVAKSPQWPSHEAAGATEEAAVHALQYRLEWELEQGRAPVLAMSP